MSLIDRLGLSVPVLQAPMAGVSTPALAVAVSNAGALGAIGLGATDAAGAQAMIKQVQAGTERAFNVNLFVHATPQSDPLREAAWLTWLQPLFARYGAPLPKALEAPYTSFNDDPDMFEMLLALRPPVISFHFGLPAPDKVQALRGAGAILLASVTSLAEARMAEEAGMDAVVAQGVEAGGHRGVFDTTAPDDGLGTVALTRLLASRVGCPVVAAGGVMDGASVAAMLALGAAAAQLGTAFVVCPESGADAAYRQTLLGPAAYHTRLVSGISGRPARALPNRLTAMLEHETVPLAPPTPLPMRRPKPCMPQPKPRENPGLARSGQARGHLWPESCPQPGLCAHYRRNWLWPARRGSSGPWPSQPRRDAKNQAAFNWASANS